MPAVKHLTKFAVKSNGWLIGRLAWLAFIWGSSFILMKRGLFDPEGNPVFSGYQVGFLRITLAGLALLPFAIKGYKKVNRSNILPLILAGVIGNGAPALLFAVAQTKINSSLAGVLNSLTPFFTLLIGIAFFKVLGTSRKFLGVFFGLAGAVALISSQSNFEFNVLDTGGYSLLVVLACVCYATSVNIIKTYLVELRPVEITSMSFSFMLIPFLIGVLVTGVPDIIINHPHGLKSLASIAILAVIGTAYAVMLFNKVIKETSALTASSVTYLIPIVAVMWGIVDGESFGWLDFTSTLLIISGVYLVNAKKT